MRWIWKGIWHWLVLDEVLEASIWLMIGNIKLTGIMYITRGISYIDDWNCEID